MVYCRKICPLLLVVLLALPRPSHAALIATYDLDSLCYISTDVVEASLTRHHQSGKHKWDDTFTATVLVPLEGRYRVGDQIKPLDLSLYNPARTGQHCILFLAGTGLFSQSLPSASAPRVVDMLLIDSHNHVRRYFQWSNPGGLVADGLAAGWPNGEDNAAEQKYPPLVEECKVITSKWATAKNFKRHRITL